MTKNPKNPKNPESKESDSDKTQMLELSDTGFTRPMIEMSKHFMEKVGMHEQTGKFIREVKTVRAQKKF